MAADAAPGGWACEQLTEYVATLADLGADRLLHVAVERAAEALEAEIGALVVDDVIEACIGFPRGQVPTALLIDIAHNGPTDVIVPNLGRCAALVVQFPSGTRGRLLVLRAGDFEWSLDERNLLRGMARVLALSRDAQCTLGALHERQALLERLTRIQRSITSRAPLPDVLEAIVSGAHALLGEAIVAYRRICADDPTMAEILCACGVEPGSSLASRIKLGDGAGGRAIVEGRLVVMHDYATSPDALDQFAEQGLQAAMAAPVREDGVTIGSLVVASAVRGRRYSEAEQEMLLAFAEHASLAVTDARTVESLRRALRDARHDAMHDVLTGLPNRALLRDRLTRASARAARHRTSVALVFVDLDGFKDVNDSLGHDVGDQLLVAVGERFIAAVRDSDTVARLGGDEFAVLVEDVDSADDLDFVAARLLDAFAEPFILDGREVSVTASVGVALCDAEAAAHQTLLRDADLAMYEAKRSGGGRHVRFAKDMHQQTVDRLNTEQALRVAIANDQLVLHYQPIFDVTNGEVVVAEALVRWQHPSRGLVMPAEFIPVAESSRLISALGEWVLRAACTEAASWPSRMRVAVNLSPRQVDANLVPVVRAILDETGLPASRLELEVTEGVAMADSPETFAVIEELHALGIHVAIDDFGTGYSSLARLRALPVDVLKIDRAFVSDVTTPRGVALISAIVALCRGSGLTAVAEGVETDEQLAVLRELGCPMAQGYLLGRPGPAADLAAIVNRVDVPQQRGLAVRAS